MTARGREAGQAAVEAVVVLPLVAVLVLTAWQGVVAGQAWWLAASAARAAARAASVGSDPTAAARWALPAGARSGMRVRRMRGRVVVRLPVPVVIGHGRLGAASASAGPEAAG